MRFLMFGIWDIPVTLYWAFYFVLGIIGFAISYFHRNLFLLAIGMIFVCSVLDFKGFYSALIGPSDYYIFQVAISIAFAVLASLAGALLNGKRAKGRIA